MKKLSVLSVLRFLWPWCIDVCAFCGPGTSHGRPIISARSRCASNTNRRPCSCPTRRPGSATTHRFYYRRIARQRLRVRDGRRRHPAEAAGLRSHAPCRRAVARVGPRLFGHPAALPELHLQRRAERDRDDHRRRALDLHARRLRLPHAGPAAARRDPPRHHRPGARRHVRRRRRGRACRRTASGWRSSTTTTSRSARSAATSASRSAPTAPKATITTAPRSPGRRTRRSSSPTAFVPAIAASCTTSRRLRKINCSREHWATQYAKPGDLLDLEQPVLFDVRSQKQIAIDSRLFPNPFDMSDLVWRKDSRALHVRIQPARPPGVPRRSKSTRRPAPRAR